MNKLILIFVLLSVVWRVINGLIEAATKKREMEREDELTQRRQDGREGVASAPTTMSVEQSSTLAPGGSKPSRAQELAARRKVQLEELRKRRAQGGPSVGRVQTKLGSTARSGIAPVTASPRSTRQSITVTSTNIKDWRREQAAMKRKAEQQQERTELARARQEDEEIRRQTQKELQRKLQQQEERKKEKARRDSLELTGMTPYGKATSGKTALSDIRRRMMDRQTLRDLFIMKELLDPPVALRSEES